MKEKWKSIKLYEHPREEGKDVFGIVKLTEMDVYVFCVGYIVMSCPQGWASKIHHDEEFEKETSMIIRGVPESVRMKFKSLAAQDGKSMQLLMLEFITRYIKHNDNTPSL